MGEGSHKSPGDEHFGKGEGQIPRTLVKADTGKGGQFGKPNKRNRNQWIVPLLKHNQLPFLSTYIFQSKLWLGFFLALASIYLWPQVDAPSVFPGGPMQETQVWSLVREDPLEEEMATLSSILVWGIPWPEEAGGIQSIGSQRAGPNWAHTYTQMHYDHLNILLLLDTPTP